MTHYRMKRLVIVIGILLSMSLTCRTGVQAAEGEANPLSADLANQVQATFRQQTLDHWFPACVDEQRGGFNATFDEQWHAVPTDIRFTVFQARMTWLSAQVARRYPDLASQFTPYARHGLKFLADVAWDAHNGGFYRQVDIHGNPTSDFDAEKHCYANSFAIYAAAAVYQTTHDQAALDLGVRAFRWLDAHAHDAKNGGYFDALQRDGTPILTPPLTDGKPRRYGDIGCPYGYKSMNSHIHLLESFTALYRVWPDPLLKSRVRELLAVVRDRIAVKPGCLNQWFTPDWHAAPDEDSFGHDVETAYLIIEAADALDDNDPGTLQVARSLVDHALDFGWDSELGALNDAGFAFRSLPRRPKICWVQAESLNALLLMHEKFGRTTDRYRDAFLQQWRFIRDHQIDQTFGGWYDTVQPDGSPTPGQYKGHIWKAAYHEGRALMQVAEQLHALTDEPQKQK